MTFARFCVITFLAATGLGFGAGIAIGIWDERANTRKADQ